MSRFSGNKPFQQEIFSRQIGEIRSLLQALELRDVFDEGENRPLMDVYETGETIVVEFDLPGFFLEDITLTMQGMSLELDAHRPREKADGQIGFVCMERSHGNFHHVVRMPVNVDPCSIKAEYRRGVLRVTCSKINDQKVPIKEIID